MAWDLGKYGDFTPKCVVSVYGGGAGVKGVREFFSDKKGEVVQEDVELWISLNPEDADRVYDLVEEGRQEEALQYLSTCPWQDFSF